MAITLTGNKATGTITSTGTTTLTDSAASFVSTLADDPRMVWLFRSGDPIGFARLKSRDSTTQLTLDSPFFDYDGDEVTQNTNDTYYITQTPSEVATTGWAVSGNVITITDQVIFGTAGSKTGLFLHSEDERYQVNYYSANAVSPLSFRGGCCTFGNPIDLKNRKTTSVCYVYWNGAGIYGNFMSIKNSAATLGHFGTVFSTEGSPARIGGGSGAEGNTNGFWHLLVNCIVENFDIVSPSGGANWTARPTFQRLINVNTVASGSNVINIRWGDGYFEGGQIKSYGSALSAFGSDIAGTYNFGAKDKERLSVFDCPNGWLWRAGGGLGTNLQTTNFTNLLVADGNKLAIDNFGPNYLTNVTFNFKWSDFYSNLINGTKVIVDDKNGTTVHTETVGADGLTDSIVLTYQTRTFPTTSTTSDTFFNDWDFSFYKYGYNQVSFAVDVFDDSLSGQTVKNVDFGGPIAQAVDVLITESDKATVDAYTEIDTSAKFYDKASSYLEDNLGTYLDFIVTRSGNLIDAGSYNVTIDATAASAFDLTGNTITIKASTFTGDITTTGSITLQNGAILIGTLTDNSGTTTRSQLTLTGLQSNSEVRVYQAGTTTEIDGVENSGTTFSTTTIESSVDVVVFNVGYVPVRLLAVDTSSNVTLPIQQRIDRNYNNP